METLTDFGKYLRKLRIEMGLRLYDMAKALGKSPAWLSYVETGKKPIPVGFADDIATQYKLPPDQRKELNRIAAKTARDFRLRVGVGASEARINAAYALARKFDELDDQELKAFLRILERKEK